MQLLRTAETLWNSSRILFDRWDLSPAQFNLLNLLVEAADGLTQSDLSRELLTHRSNITGLVDRLERRGLVARRDQVGDRRAWRIVLTPAGRRLMMGRFSPTTFVLPNRCGTGFPSVRRVKSGMSSRRLRSIRRPRAPASPGRFRELRTAHAESQKLSAPAGQPVSRSSGGQCNSRSHRWAAHAAATVGSVGNGGPSDPQRPVHQPAVFPYVLLAPLAGYLNDRFAKTQWLLGGNALKVLGTAVCGLSIWFGYAWQAPGYLIVGIGSTLYGPAKYGILPEILPRDRLVKANGLVELLTLLAILLGAIAGSVLVDRLPVGICYGILLGVFGASTVLNLFMARTPSDPTTRRRPSVPSSLVILADCSARPAWAGFWPEPHCSGCVARQ